MSPVLLIHIAAGSLGIATGTGAAVSLKGARAHRLFGIAFCSAMTIMAIIGGYLALFTTSSVAAAPPQASVVVAALTLYLIFTAWLTVRRKSGQLGMAEHVAALAVMAISATLLLLGAKAEHAGGPPGSFVPYFVFAAFAIVSATLDMRLIRTGGVVGARRIARHLWRMCFAWFFATAFFFLGQQRVMPVWMRGSPVLTFLAVAPLITMLVWLVRIWATTAGARQPSTSTRRWFLKTVAFKERRAACP
jgi:hypothetical protein